MPFRRGLNFCIIGSVDPRVGIPLCSRFFCFNIEIVILEMWDDEDYEPAPLDSGKVVEDKWDGEDEEVSSEFFLVAISNTMTGCNNRVN